MIMSTIPRAPMSSVEPPRWLWLWFPPLLLIVEQLIFSRTFYYQDLIYREPTGLVELATPVATALAVVAGIAALRHRTRLPWLRGWVVFVTLSCVYATGEEVNWGQFLFGWATPEWLAAIEENGVGTSLSSIGGRVEETPKILLELFVLCGIINVLLQRGVERRRHDDWFWPTYVCLPSALLALLLAAPLRVPTWEEAGPDLLNAFYLSGWSELEELYLALFLLLYLWSIWHRLGMGERAPPRG